MTPELLSNLGDSLQPITLIIKHLNEARVHEEALLKGIPKSEEGGLYEMKHQEILIDINDAIYSLTQAEACICTVLDK